MLRAPGFGLGAWAWTVRPGGVWVFERFGMSFCVSDWGDVFVLRPSEDEAQADRAIRTGQLHALLRFHTRPIDVVVFHGSQRDLILRLVSRLDAFSGYPFPT